MASNLRPIRDPEMASLAAAAASLVGALPRRPSGMSSTRFAVFTAIGQAGATGITLAELSRLADLKPEPLREHLRALRWRGLVERRVIRLTEGGQSLLADRAPDIDAPAPFDDTMSPTGVVAPAADDAPTIAAAGHVFGTPVEDRPAAEAAAPVGSESDEATGAVSRLEMIRKAAQRLADRGQPVARLPLAAPTRRPGSCLANTPDWTAERRERLQGAIAFLRSRCVLVWPDNRDALVRRYRMTGNFNLFTAEQVIGRAERLGWDGGVA